jgi:hypothetical protein
MPSPKIFTNILLKYGLKQNNTYQKLGEFTAYPVEYFCPKSFNTGKLRITENTYSIHHYDASWTSKTDRKYHKIINRITGTIGENKLSKLLVLFVYLAQNIEEKGWASTIKLYCRKLTKQHG